MTFINEQYSPTFYCSKSYIYNSQESCNLVELYDLFYEVARFENDNGFQKMGCLDQWNLYCFFKIILSKKKI